MMLQQSTSVDKYNEYYVLPYRTRTPPCDEDTLSFMIVVALSCVENVATIIYIKTVVTAVLRRAGLKFEKWVLADN